MIKKADIPGHVIETALRLAAERGWSRLSYGEIAEVSGIPLSTLYPIYPTKAAILVGFLRMIDAAVMADADTEDDDGESARDRLFDVMMRRYDAVRPYREGIGNVMFDLRREPRDALAFLPAMSQSMSLMLELAGLSSSGLAGLARTKGLLLIHMATMRVFLRDDSVDLAKTMAALDGRLRNLESLVRRFGPERGREGGEAPSAAE